MMMRGWQGHGVRNLSWAVGLFLVGGAEAVAQNRLPGVTELSCSFSLVATGTWTDDITPSVELEPSRLRFRFVEIDTDGATAEAEGDFGGSHIITRLSGDYLHFVQMFRSGPLYTTTVINRETTDGRLKAVHTRHEYNDFRLEGHTSRPEHYYGDCEIDR